MGYPRVTHPFAALPRGKPRFVAPLACVKHAASVRPEPGSNSPLTSTNCVPKDLRPSTVDPDKLITCQRNPSSTEPRPGRRRGVKLFVVDFWHTVEFSRITRAPSRSAARRPAPGQLSYLTEHAPAGQTGSGTRSAPILGSTRVLVLPRGQIRFPPESSTRPEALRSATSSDRQNLRQGSNLSQIPGGVGRATPGPRRVGL